MWQLKSLLSYFFDEEYDGKKRIFKNRYFRAIVYVVVCLFTTLIYAGWQDFQLLLYKNGTYRWLCTPEEINNFSRPDTFCETQNKHTQSFFTISQAAEFGFAIIAGVCVDKLGPLITSFIGNIMLFLGLVFVFYSHEHFQAYIPGFILFAGSINMIAFPCLEMEQLFPNQRRLVLSIIVAAQTGGTFVPVVLRNISDSIPSLSIKSIIWLYIVIIQVPLFILSMLVHPKKHLYLLKTPVNTSSTESKTHLLNANFAVNIEESAVEYEPNTNENKPLTDNTEIEKLSKTKWLKEVSYQIWTQDYILFTIYYIISVMAQGFYPTIVRQNFVNYVADFQGAFLPSQALWGVLCGYIVDYIKTLPVCFTITILFLAATFTALNPTNVSMQYASSVLYVVANSYIYTTKYTFLVDCYGSKNFGTLVGLIGFLSGLFSLINIIFETQSYYIHVLWMYVGFLFLNLGILIYLSYRQIKKKYFQKPQIN